jgi:hypothetical protein
MKQKIKILFLKKKKEKKKKKKLWNQQEKVNTTSIKD